ncbi:MAG: hypothetical protein JO072_15960 [Parafilimonas sp.]|nr:hypothetical protein [Parafilimonas sp.]
MLSKQIVWLDFDYKNNHYEGEAIDISSVKNNCLLPAFDIYFNNEYTGTMRKQQDCWVADSSYYMEEGIAKIIGRKLYSFLTPELKD